MTKYKGILKYRNLMFSARQIANILSVSRNTISKVYVAADMINMDWEEASVLSEEEIAKRLFPPSKQKSVFEEPDVDWVHSEMKRSGVTLSLLWKEYVHNCSSRDTIPLQYSQFCKRYRDHRVQHRATMHFEHQPADRVEVDWAGTKIPIYNVFGEQSFGYLFVATLPFSQYSFAEVLANMKQESWIQAHVNMFTYFNGVPLMVYPDNLKTGITSNPKHEEAVINKAYEEMANYYGTAIVPTLPRSPKGKPSVESTVGKVTSHLIARFRNDVFTSIHEANKCFRGALNEFNEAPFQKRDGSRKDVFEEYEKASLKPLPNPPYEYGEWKTCSVQFNYHIQVLKNYYSVPYEYIRRKVEVRITNKTVEIYSERKRICSHVRIHGENFQYSTKEDHMPDKHQKALAWSGSRFREWAKKIGPYTYDVIDRLLKSYKVEQQGYKGCNALLHLSDNNSQALLEQCCKKGLELLTTPRYKDIKRLMVHCQQNEISDQDNTDDGAIVRGEAYYGGKSDE